MAGIYPGRSEMIGMKIVGAQYIAPVRKED